MADTIYFNGYIYTADNQNTVSQAVAIRNGLILAVGSNENIINYANENSQ